MPAQSSIHTHKFVSVVLLSIMVNMVVSCDSNTVAVKLPPKSDSIEPDSTKPSPFAFDTIGDYSFLSDYTFPLSPTDASRAVRVASRLGDEEVIRSLTSSPLIFAIPDSNGRGALHEAASHSQAEVVELLVGLGATVTNRNTKGETPLFEAVRADSIETAAKLVRYGAQVTNTTFLGRHFPLYYARSSQMIDFLLGQGAELHQKDFQQNTAICGAVEAGKIDAVKHYVALGHTLDETNSVGMTLLHAAAHSGQTNSISYLLQEGAKIDALDRDGYSALHKTVTIYRHDEAAALLLRGGANARIPIPNDSWTLLHYAARDNLTNSIKELCRRGLKADSKEDAGATPIHLAAHNGNSQVLATLLEQEPNIEVTWGGQTPLQTAIAARKKACALQLLNKGASTAVLDARGYTPLHCAVERGLTTVAKEIYRQSPRLITQTTGDGRSCLHLAILKDDLDMVDWLLTTPIDRSLSIETRVGRRTAFEIASLHGSVLSKIVGHCEQGREDFALLSKIPVSHLLSYLARRSRPIEFMYVAASLKPGWGELLRASISAPSADLLDQLTGSSYSDQLAKKENRSYLFDALENSISITNTTHFGVLLELSETQGLLNETSFINKLLNGLISRLKSGKNIILSQLEQLVATLERVNPTCLQGFKSSGDSWTIAHIAALSDSLHILRIAQRLSISTDLAEGANESPLALAITKGSLQVASSVLSSRSKMNQKGLRTFLKLAADRGEDRFVIEHLGRYQGLKEISSNDTLFFFSAVRHCGLEVIDRLLNISAGTVLTNNAGQTLLHEAVQRPGEGVFKLLLEKVPILPDSKGETPLHIAARNSHRKVEMLLEHEADLEHKSIYASTPFLEAVGSGNLDSAVTLMEAGADLSVVDTMGNTAMHRAAHRGALDTVMFLSASGLKLTTTNSIGMTPFLLSGFGKNEDLVNFFLHRGASIGEATKYGETILHNAAAGGNHSMIDYLVQCGADISKKGGVFGETPVLRAAAAGNHMAMKALMSHGADISVRTAFGSPILDRLPKERHKAFVVKRLIHKEIAKWVVAAKEGDFEAWMKLARIIDGRMGTTGVRASLSSKGEREIKEYLDALDQLHPF